MRKWMWFTMTMVLVGLVSAYPAVDFRSVDKETQKAFIEQMKSIDERHYDGVKKIFVYKMDIWHKADAWYIPFWNKNGGYIVLDDVKSYRSGSFKELLKHELAHNNCWRGMGDLSHDSQCFTNGLD